MELPLNVHGYLSEVKFVLTFDGIFLLEADNHHRYRYSGGVHMKGGPALLSRTDYPRSRLGIFHINALRRSGSRRASKSKLHIYDKVCLCQHFFRIK